MLRVHPLLEFPRNEFPDVFDLTPTKLVELSIDVDLPSAASLQRGQPVCEDAGQHPEGQCRQTPETEGERRVHREPPWMP